MKNEEKAPSDANKRGEVFGSRNTVQREASAGTIKALNALHSKFNCGEGNEGRLFLECLQVTTAYLSTNLEGGVDVKMLIQNGKVFKLVWPEPFGPNPASTKAML